MKLLVIADAVTQTGFARVTHNVCRGLKARGWEVHILALNYFGDATPLQKEFDLYPAVLGGDSYGHGRLRALINNIKPAAVLIINDPWIVRDYLTEIPKTVPVVAYMPVDAPHQSAAKNLNGLARAIAYTKFGRRELMLGGYTGQCDVIPHGVDLKMYNPRDRAAGRQRLRFKKKMSVPMEDLFIVGNVNRNMIRKRLDLMMQYWTQWWVSAGNPEHAFLYFHTSNKEAEGWDLIDMARYFGIEEQFILTNPEMTVENCIPEEEMSILYSLMDVLGTTSLGEGWGLPPHEAAACKVGLLLPRYSALGEIWKDAAHFVDCKDFQWTNRRINTIGGVADKAQFVAGLDKFYRDREYRVEMQEKAFARATEAQYDWDTISGQFDRVLLEVVSERRVTPMGVEARNG